jgi:hypothetical protein
MKVREAQTAEATELGSIIRPRIELAAESAAQSRNSSQHPKRSADNLRRARSIHLVCFGEQDLRKVMQELVHREHAIPCA